MRFLEAAANHLNSSISQGETKFTVKQLQNKTDCFERRYKEVHDTMTGDGFGRTGWGTKSSLKLKIQRKLKHSFDVKEFL